VTGPSHHSLLFLLCVDLILFAFDIFVYLFVMLFSLVYDSVIIVIILIICYSSLISYLVSVREWICIAHDR